MNWDLHPIYADKTSDQGDRDWAQRLDEARTRHRRDMDELTLGDIACDNRLLEAWRTGDTTVMGMVLADLVDEYIERTAQKAAS